MSATTAAGGRFLGICHFTWANKLGSSNVSGALQDEAALRADGLPKGSDLCR